MDFRQALIVWIIAVALTGMISGCKPADPFTKVSISGPLRLGPEVQEFVFAYPFKPFKQVSEVCFGYSDSLIVKSISDPPRFADGINLEVTGAVVDESGREWPLTNIASSAENYLCLTPPFTEWLRVEQSKLSFTKLRVRSSRPVNLTKIEWSAFNSWDL